MSPRLNPPLIHPSMPSIYPSPYPHPFPYLCIDTNHNGCTCNNELDISRDKNTNIFLLQQCNSLQFHVITIWVVNLKTIRAGWNDYNSGQFCVTIQVGQLLQSRAILLQFKSKFWGITIQGNVCYNSRQALQVGSIITIQGSTHCRDDYRDLGHLDSNSNHLSL